MPSIPLTAQTHSWVSGEGYLGKNKVSFNREQRRAWETRWLCFPPTNEPVPQARSSHFQNRKDVEEANVEVSLDCFVYTMYHPSLYKKNADLFMAEQTAHTWRISDISTITLLWFPLSASNHIIVNTLAAYGSKSNAQHHGTHLHGQLTWHFYCLQWKKGNIPNFGWTEKHLNGPHLFILTNF